MSNDNVWADTPDEAEEFTQGTRRNITNLQPKVGENVIRIVSQRHFFKRYYFSTIKRSAIAGELKNCPVFNNPNKQKMFDEAKALRDSGKEKEAKTKYKEAFRLYEPSKVYAINVIDRTDGQVKIWQFSRAIKERIEQLATRHGNPMEFDLILTRKGTKLETRYTLDAGDKKPLTEAEKQLKPYNLVEIFKPTPIDILKQYANGVIPSRQSTESQETTNAVEPKTDLSEEERRSLASFDSNQLEL